MAIINPKSEELRRVRCPGAEPIGDVRGTRLPNAPGVRCHISHDTLDVERNPATLVKFCCNEGRMGRAPEDFGEGFMACPVWQFEQMSLEAGGKSLSDPDELERANERARRYDLTGSEYGDVSMMDAMESDVQDARLMLEAGESVNVGTGD